MFLTVAKCFIRRYETYPSVIITNENGKGKPFFSYSMIFLRLLFSMTKSVPHLQLIDNVETPQCDVSTH